MTYNSSCIRILDKNVCNNENECEWTCSRSSGKCECQNSSDLLLIILLVVFLTLFVVVVCYCFLAVRSNYDEGFICPCYAMCKTPPLMNMNAPDYAGTSGRGLVLTGPPQLPFDDDDDGLQLPPRGQRRWMGRRGRSGRHMRFRPEPNVMPEYYNNNGEQQQQPAHPPRGGSSIAPPGVTLVGMRHRDGRVAYSSSAPDGQEELDYDDDEEMTDDMMYYEDDEEDYDDGRGFYPQPQQQPRQAFSTEPFEDGTGFRVSRQMQGAGGGGGGGGDRRPAPVHPPPPPNLRGKRVRFAE